MSHFVTGHYFALNVVVHYLLHADKIRKQIFCRAENISGHSKNSHKERYGTRIVIETDETNFPKTVTMNLLEQASNPAQVLALT